MALASPKGSHCYSSHIEPQLILMDMNFSLTAIGWRRSHFETGETIPTWCSCNSDDSLGSIETCGKGMKAGAFDFITKPWNNAMLLQRIETTIELNAKVKDVPVNDHRLKDHEEECTFDGLSLSVPVRRSTMLDVIKRVAKTNASVSDYRWKRNRKGTYCRSIT